MVISAFFVVILSLLFFFRHGIDITDEGLYLLSSKHPKDVLVCATSAYYFIHPLFKMVNFDIYGIRLVGMLILIFSGMLAGWAFYKSVSHSIEVGYSKMAEFAFAALGGLGAAVYYIWGIYSPGYNATIAWAVNLSAAFISFFHFQSENKLNPIRHSAIMAFFWGVIIAIGFFSKITSAAGLFLTAFLWILFTAPSGRSSFWTIMSFLSGFITVFIFFFLFMENIDIWFRHSFLNGWVAILITSGDSMNFCKRHAAEFFYSLKETLFVFRREILLLLATRLLIEFKKDKEKVFLYTSIFIVTLSIIIHAYIAHCFLGGFHHLYDAYVFFLLWIILLFLGPLIKAISFWLGAVDDDSSHFSISDRLKRIIFYFMLFLLPYIGAFGTGNPIMRNVVMNIAPWFCLFLLFWTNNIKSIWPCWFYKMIPALISMAAASQIITAPIISPYGINVNVLAQNELLTYGLSNSRIFLDKPTADFFVSLKQITSEAGFKPGDNILAFTDMAGVVFILGGRSPGVPWYMGKYMSLYHNKEYNEFGLSLISSEAIAKSLILQKMDDLSGMPNLMKYNINFPKDYVLLAQLIWPATNEIVKVWKPRLVKADK